MRKQGAAMGLGLCWAVFFASILGAWAVLFASHPRPVVPPEAAIFGPEFWLALCISGARDASYPVLLGMWVLMAVVMMAPTAFPTFKTFGDLVLSGAASRTGFGALIVGYVTAWGGFALVAAYLQLRLGDARLLDQNAQSISPLLNAALLGIAGVYQFTPLKEACLDKCRTPMAFFLSFWRDGVDGAFRMGVRLGVYCIGCCWALMLLAFIGGAMNLLWMGGAMVLMGLEKLPGPGRWLTYPLGLVLLAGAAWMVA